MYHHLEGEKKKSESLTFPRLTFRGFQGAQWKENQLQKQTTNTEGVPEGSTFCIGTNNQRS